jgi:hypothetical protein
MMDALTMSHGRKIQAHDKTEIPATQTLIGGQEGPLMDNWQLAESKRKTNVTWL